MTKKGNRKHTSAKPVSRKNKPPIYIVWALLFSTLLVAGWAANQVYEMYTAIQESQAEPKPADAAGAGAEAESEGIVYPEPDFEVLSLEEIQKQKLIINVHEHIGSLDLAPIFVNCMDRIGIGKMCLMGSSMFTLTLDEAYGFTGHHDNNEELLKIMKAYPGRFEAWVTIEPREADKLKKFKSYIERGATGLKLYTGHGYTTKANEYMFHTRAMDDPEMYPVYAYCEENFIPICLHVNPYKGKPGFAQELIAILTDFPDMKIDCPHFMLSSIMSSRLREYLDTFPNLYSNISFGDYFAKAGLKRISRKPEKFKKLFADYPDRFFYATDLVLTRGKKEDWAMDQFQAYLDMLSCETYTAPFIPGETLRGLALPDHLLQRVLYKNYEAFKAKKPRDTKITREINWDNMNVTPLVREQGQMFPPPPKKKKK
jgi:predicted TIM-barrel fold metal-dependent hydrolase